MTSIGDDRPCAVIVGGGRGIGRAIAIKLARDNYDVVIASRTEIELEAVRSSIVEADIGARCLTVVADALKDSDVRNLFEVHKKFSGRLDILINSQGCAELGGVAETEPKTFEEMVLCNLTSVYRTVYFARASLFESKGAIVNIISRAGRQPYPNALGYGSAKAGLVYLTRSLALNLKDHSIRVFGVSPGAVSTNLRKRLFPDENHLELLSPESVAEVVTNLVGPQYFHASGTIIDFPW